MYTAQCKREKKDLKVKNYNSSWHVVVVSTWGVIFLRLTRLDFYGFFNETHLVSFFVFRLK